MRSVEAFRALSLLQRIDTASRLIRGVLCAPKFDQKGWILAGPGLRIHKRFGEINLGQLVGFGSHVGLAAVGCSNSAKAVLRIGDHTFIQDRTHINCYHSIVIGNHCAISWDVEILDTDIHTILNDKGEPITNIAPVIIEDRVWIGARAIVLKGVTIGHDSIVAAGAVVTRTIPPYSICAGNPATVIRTSHGWIP